MSKRKIEYKRKTRETDISIILDPDIGGNISIETSVPFLDHMLLALAHHGGFSLTLKARGDIDIDYHHLVEDIGISLGETFGRVFREHGSVARFGHSLIPMDEALSEAVIDVCGRPVLVYKADYPQPLIKDFDLSLMKEFFIGFVSKAEIALHLICRHGENSHHMIEALFKAFGKALSQAYTPMQGGGEAMSTKGSIG
ncbi:MAG: imidazoleglycerol-phosphate dehydratase HisB [Spirochaetales bacterium]|nr:imidazoleglycerol-phosphate dehydratase HisB [Spirochaetales bacterium]